MKPHFRIKGSQLKQIEEISDNNKDIFLDVYERSKFSWRAFWSFLLITTVAVWLLTSTPINEIVSALLISFILLGFCTAIALGAVSNKVYNRYPLMGALAFAEVNSFQSEKLKRTVKRNSKVVASLLKILLLGSAGAYWKEGKGFAAGAWAGAAQSLDTSPEVSIRENVEIEEWTEAELYFLDGTHKTVRVPEYLSHLLAAIPIFDNNNDYKTLSRMEDDATRVADELEIEIRHLELSFSHALEKAQNGDTFNQREAARETLADVTMSLQKRRALQAHLRRVSNGVRTSGAEYIDACSFDSAFNFIIWLFSKEAREQM